MTTLTQERLKELFDYKNGSLIWNVRVANRVHVGDVAGGTNGQKDPYVRVRVDGKRYLLHRLIYAWHTGLFYEIIDHANGNIHDNRIENLRPATSSQNQQNSCTPKNNTSGSKNVSWNKRQSKWCVFLRIHNRKKHIGVFKDFELADLVAQEARALYFGQFARNH
jgi:hypothetical protein